MTTLTIEIPEEVEKTFIDLVALLGGRVLKKDLKVKAIEEILSVNNVEAIEPVDLPAIVFMKFGYHAKEEKSAIIERKKNEFKKTGKIFWGYGGNVCHPEKQVRQFVKSMNLQGKKVFLAMSFTKSKATMTNRTSLQYSVDNSNWNNVPDGIEVRGSKYAIVCSELLDCNINLNLTDYEVAVGDKKGKRASDYIKGQNDKGCLIKSEALASSTNMFNDINKVEISLLAEIVEPYAVFMSQD